MDVRLLEGDCLEVMKTLPAESFDAVVTDPPAGIAFMGKEWDTDKGGRGRWIEWLTPRMAEAYRLAKPGTYALVWALPRTSHWTATAVEDAGWTIRDRVTHLFGTGFPKAKSCLKPGAEDWWLAYKPGGRMSELQIDACRIETADNLNGGAYAKDGCDRHDGDENWRYRRNGDAGEFVQPTGRWPANVVLDDDAAAILDEMSGTLKSGLLLPHHQDNGKESGRLGGFSGKTGRQSFGDSGGASRFFYCPKASREDRGPGNDHPTIKNVNLMRWLCRLITPPGGDILDPFAGTASTGKAAILEGFGFTGIEQSPHYAGIGRGRLEEARVLAARPHAPLPRPATKPARTPLFAE